MRADPRRSFDSACRHLFRHLRDEGELRKNPLVNWYFALPSASSGPRSDATVVAQIQHAVRTHAALLFNTSMGADWTVVLAKRRLSILLDGDLGGEPPIRLCAKLGISRRQFSRDRQLARQAIAARLRDQIPSPGGLAVSTFVRPSSDVEFTKLAVLMRVAAVQPAIEQVARYVAEVSDPLDAVRGLCLQASTELGRKSDLCAARTCIARAWNLIQEAAAATSRATVRRAELLLVNADLFKCSGNLGEAIAQQDDAISALHRHIESGAAEPRRVLARALDMSAYYNLLAGCLGAAGDRLSQAETLLGSTPYVPPTLRFELLLTRASLFAERGQYRLAIAAAEEALLAAESYGLPDKVIVAKTLLAEKLVERGEAARAAVLLREALPEAEGLEQGMIADTIRVTMLEIDASLKLKDPAHLYASAKAALAQVPFASELWVRLKILESSALLPLCRTEEAIAAAIAADEASLRIETPTLRVATKRNLAQTYHAGAQGASARTAIAEALELSMSGSLLQAALAQKAAAAITENAGHAREASRIFRALRAS